MQLHLRVTTVQQRRGEATHAFDRHGIDAWTAAFARVPFEFSLLCRGGERFLATTGELPHLRYTRVDTNGSWSPDRYAAVPLSVRNKIQLNVSFHPTQIALDVFAKRLAKIIDGGWNVAMINDVMEAGQSGDYERVREYFREHGDIYVNPNPDAFDPAWTGLAQIGRQAQTKLRPLLPDIDVTRKTGTPTMGKPCYFPSIGYFVAPDGMAERACTVSVPGEPRRLDFINASPSLRPLATPVCPLPSCLCLARYAFLEEVPTRGRRLDLLSEYVTDCRARQT